MPGAAAQLLLLVGPLAVTWWVVLAAAAVTIFVLGLVVLRHLQWTRAARRREKVRAELEPIFARFLATEDQAQLEEEFHASLGRLDAAHRPVAAVLIIDLMREATSHAQTEGVRQALVESGLVELGEKGTRRFSPWRRALACELLGKIGAPRSVPALLERLEDRRPEVRIAAVRALGDIGSAEAAPALSRAFLERRVAPTSFLNDALRRIGGGVVGPTFERGLVSADTVVRISACFGMAASAATHGSAVVRLAEVLATDSEARVRTAAASSLGIAGGGNAPPALVAATADPDHQVRRSAVKALGRFDDPMTPDALDTCTEDEDREVAIRSAEALLALAKRPRAGAEARARLESSSAWAVDYARTVAEVSG
jgi:HEAT repeat protein